MTHQELLALLRSTGIGDVSYDHFDQEPATSSYLTYWEADPDEFHADDVVYVSQKVYRVDLYTDKKSPAVEKQLEQALTGAEIQWDKAVSEWLEESSQYVTAYELLGDYLNG